MFPNVNKPHSNNAMLENEMESNQVAPLSPPFIRPSVLGSISNAPHPYTTAINIEQLPSTVNLPGFQRQLVHQPTIDPSDLMQPLEMPANSSPWQCPVWMSSPDLQPGTYMTFNGQRKPHMPIKRKAAHVWDPIIKSKQLVTEEKMIAHLNSIHISSDYTTHDSTEDTSCEKIDDSPDDNDQACSVQDIEQKLRQANRITVSDVVRTIRNDPLLPAAILERYERPSKALVLWQPPPQRITDLFTARVTQEANQSEDESNNNTDSNVEFEDATSAAEMDLDT